MNSLLSRNLNIVVIVVVVVVVVVPGNMWPERGSTGGGGRATKTLACDQKITVIGLVRQLKKLNAIY